MARLKRKSLVLEKASKRLAGVETISMKLDLGNGLSVPAYNAKVSAVTSKLDAYNQLLSKVDTGSTELKQMEKELNDMSLRMREAVGSAYGHDSIEYEKAGGIRSSNRKKPKGKPPVNPKPAA
jgi:hypothetical protein